MSGSSGTEGQLAVRAPLDPAVVAELPARLARFYNKFHPENVPKVAKFLRAYRGAEHELVAKLETRYPASPLHPEFAPPAECEATADGAGGGAPLPPLAPPSPAVVPPPSPAVVPPAPEAETCCAMTAHSEGGLRSEDDRRPRPCGTTWRTAQQIRKQQRAGAGGSESSLRRHRGKLFEPAARHAPDPLAREAHDRIRAEEQQHQRRRERLQQPAGSTAPRRLAPLSRSAPLPTTAVPIPASRSAQRSGAGVGASEVEDILWRIHEAAAGSGLHPHEVDLSHIDLPVADVAVVAYALSRAVPLHAVHLAGSRLAAPSLRLLLDAIGRNATPITRALVGIEAFDLVEPTKAAPTGGDSAQLLAQLARWFGAEAAPLLLAMRAQCARNATAASTRVPPAPMSASTAGSPGRPSSSSSTLRCQPRRGGEGDQRRRKGAAAERQQLATRAAAGDKLAREGQVARQRIADAERKERVQLATALRVALRWARYCCELRTQRTALSCGVSAIEHQELAARVSLFRTFAQQLAALLRRHIAAPVRATIAAEEAAARRVLWSQYCLDWIIAARGMNIRRLNARAPLAVLEHECSDAYRALHRAQWEQRMRLFAEALQEHSELQRVARERIGVHFGAVVQSFVVDSFRDDDDDDAEKDQGGNSARQLAQRRERARRDAFLLRLRALEDRESVSRTALRVFEKGDQPTLRNALRKLRNIGEAFAGCKRAIRTAHEAFTLAVDELPVTEVYAPLEAPVAANHNYAALVQGGEPPQPYTALTFSAPPSLGEDKWRLTDTFSEDALICASHNDGATTSAAGCFRRRHRRSSAARSAPAQHASPLSFSCDSADGRAAESRLGVVVEPSVQCAVHMREWWATRTFVSAQMLLKRVRMHVPRLQQLRDQALGLLDDVERHIANSESLSAEEWAWPGDCRAYFVGGVAQCEQLAATLQCGNERREDRHEEGDGDAPGEQQQRQETAAASVSPAPFPTAQPHTPRRVGGLRLDALAMLERVKCSCTAATIVASLTGTMDNSDSGCSRGNDGRAPGVDIASGSMRVCADEAELRRVCGLPATTMSYGQSGQLVISVPSPVSGAQITALLACLQCQQVECEGGPTTTTTAEACARAIVDAAPHFAAVHVRVSVQVPRCGLQEALRLSRAFDEADGQEPPTQPPADAAGIEIRGETVLRRALVPPEIFCVDAEPPHQATTQPLLRNTAGPPPVVMLRSADGKPVDVSFVPERLAFRRAPAVVRVADEVAVASSYTVNRARRAERNPLTISPCATTLQFGDAPPGEAALARSDEDPVPSGLSLMVEIVDGIGAGDTLILTPSASVWKDDRTGVVRVHGRPVCTVLYHSKRTSSVPSSASSWSSGGGGGPRSPLTTGRSHRRVSVAQVASSLGSSANFKGPTATIPAGVRPRLGGSERSRGPRGGGDGAESATAMTLALTTARPVTLGELREVLAQVAFRNNLLEADVGVRVFRISLLWTKPDSTLSAPLTMGGHLFIERNLRAPDHPTELHIAQRTHIYRCPLPPPGRAWGPHVRPLVLRIAENARIVDPDSEFFRGGFLEVTMANGAPGDTLMLELEEIAADDSARGSVRVGASPFSQGRRAGLRQRARERDDLESGRSPARWSTELCFDGVVVGCLSFEAATVAQAEEDEATALHHQEEEQQQQQQQLRERRGIVLIRGDFSTDGRCSITMVQELLTSIAYTNTNPTFAPGITVIDVRLCLGPTAFKVDVYGHDVADPHASDATSNLADVLHERITVQRRAALLMPRETDADDDAALQYPENGGWRALLPPGSLDAIPDGNFQGASVRIALEPWCHDAAHDHLTFLLPGGGTSAVPGPERDTPSSAPPSPTKGTAALRLDPMGADELELILPRAAAPARGELSLRRAPSFRVGAPLVNLFDLPLVAETSEGHDTRRRRRSSGGGMSPLLGADNNNGGRMAPARSFAFSKEVASAVVRRAMQVRLRERGLDDAFAREVVVANRIVDIGNDELVGEVFWCPSAGRLVASFFRAPTAPSASVLQRLLESLAFANTNRDPLQLQRRMTITLETPNNGASSLRRMLSIVPYDDPTDIVLTRPRLSYRVGATEVEPYTRQLHRVVHRLREKYAQRSPAHESSLPFPATAAAQPSGARPCFERLGSLLLFHPHHTQVSDADTEFWDGGRVCVVLRDDGAAAAGARRGSDGPGGGSSGGGLLLLHLLSEAQQQQLTRFLHVRRSYDGTGGQTNEEAEAAAVEEEDEDGERETAVAVAAGPPPVLLRLDSATGRLDALLLQDSVPVAAEERRTVLHLGTVSSPMTLVPPTDQMLLPQGVRAAVTAATAAGSPSLADARSPKRADAAAAAAAAAQGAGTLLLQVDFAPRGFGERVVTERLMALVVHSVAVALRGPEPEAPATKLYRLCVFDACNPLPGVADVAVELLPRLLTPPNVASATTPSSNKGSGGEGPTNALVVPYSTRQVAPHGEPILANLACALADRSRLPGGFIEIVPLAGFQPRDQLLLRTQGTQLFVTSDGLLTAGRDGAVGRVTMGPQYIRLDFGVPSSSPPGATSAFRPTGRRLQQFLRCVHFRCDGDGKEAVLGDRTAAVAFSEGVVDVFGREEVSTLHVVISVTDAPPPR